MTTTIRELSEADADAVWQLGRLAFGGPAQPPSDGLFPRSGIRTFGVFDGDRLIGKAAGLAHSYWWGGRIVPGVGVAGVAIAPEYRGRKLLAEAISELLAAARTDGAAISALFPTTIRPYRRMGWERVGSLVRTAIPTTSVHGPVPTGVSVRPARAADVPAMLDLYSDAGLTGNGLLSRTGPLFDLDPAAVLAGHDGYTVAEQDGGVVGWFSWDRGVGYDASAILDVPDLFGASRDALMALLSVLGTWRSVTPTLHLRLRPNDPVWLAHGLAGARLHSEQVWMVRLVDAAAAVAARGWPRLLSGSIDLQVDDTLCPWNAGGHRLILDAGRGRLEPGGAGHVRLDAGALAALYAGVASPADLRRLGRIHGGDADTDEFLTLAGAGPAPALLDYF